MKNKTGCSYIHTPIRMVDVSLCGRRLSLENCLQVSVPEATFMASAAVASLLAAAPALADIPSPPPEVQQAIKPSQNQSMTFPSSEAPAPATTSSNGLPEGNQWRYSEFISAVEKGKVERVRFSKDGSQLQLTAIDGRRAQVRCLHTCPYQEQTCFHSCLQDYGQRSYMQQHFEGHCDTCTHGCVAFSTVQ